MDEVVAIQHIAKSGDKVYDGSGIVIPYNGHSLLVTCKHVLDQDYTEHFMQYCGQIHIINEHNGLKSSPFQPLPINEEVFQDDYAFMEFTSSCKSKLELGNSADVGVEDEIVLVAHERTSGNQIRLPGVRRNDKNYAEHEWTDGSRYRGLNTMFIDINGIIKGFSGGAIIHTATGKCIGILKGRERDFQRFAADCFYMLQAETFLERYMNLKGMNHLDGARL